MVVSFQRFPLGIFDATAERQRSFGALPVARMATDRYLVPVAADEAVWLGVLPVTGTTAVSLGVADRNRHELDALDGRLWDPLRAAKVIVPPPRMIYGYRRPDGGLNPFCRQATLNPGAGVKYLRIVAIRTRDHGEAHRRFVSVELVDFSSYEERTGNTAPGPLDLSASYKGERLP